MSDAALSRLRQGRQVSLLHGQHRRRPHRGRLDMSEHRPSGDAQRLRGRAEEGPPVAAGAGERRGEGGGRQEGGLGGGRQGFRGAREGQRRKTRRKEKPKEPVKVQIDLERIGQRILALPIPARNYVGLLRGQGRRALPGRGSASRCRQTTRRRWSSRSSICKTRKTDKLLEGVTAFVLSANGEKMLFRQGGDWIIAADRAGAGQGRAKGALKLEDHGSLRRPARGVEADVPRGLAHRARLLLRSRPSRPRPGGGGGDVRAVPRWRSAAAPI